MRAWQAIVLAVFAATAGLATGSTPVQIAALALVAIILIGVIYRALLRGDVRSERAIGDPVVPWGDVFEQRITLTNSSRLPIPAIRVTDETTLPDHPHGYVTSLGAGKSVTWEVGVPCTARGRYVLGPVIAAMSDPLGLFPVERLLGARSSLLVLPRWVPLARSALKLDGFMPGEAKGRRRGDSPPAVVSVREYAEGDSVSSIHWPATARAGTLMTKLFDPEVQTTLWLALDLDGDLDADVEELIVTAAASLGIYGVRKANLRVGLVASGSVSATVPAERGRAHQYLLQEVLAEVHAGAGASLQDALAAIDRQLGPGQVLVLLTARGPGAWQAWLDRLGRRGVATRVVEVLPAGDETLHGWPVPTIRLPVGVGDPAREGELAAALEGTTHAAR